MCSELGTNTEQWDKLCPIRTPKWMTAKVDRFVDAVDDFLAGDRNACLEKISQIRSDEITEWYVEHGQMSGRHRKLALGVAPPPNIPTEHRDLVRSPRKLQNAVFERDGYACRYCGNRLIAHHFLKLFINALNSDLFKKGGTNRTTHGIIHLTWPVADHVLPWNKGGQTNMENLVSACATCNYGKDGYTIEQLGIEDPLARKPTNGNWSGLTDKIVQLMQLVQGK